MSSVRSLRWIALTSLVFLGIGCTLITEVDRSKIPAEDGGGEAPTDDGSTDGE